jgi:predicted transcriptional regulator
MMTKVWDQLLQRVQSWPDEAQEELAQIVEEIEAELNESPYDASPAELLGVERGLRDAAEGKFASPEQVEAVFAKYRR